MQYTVALRDTDGCTKVANSLVLDNPSALRASTSFTFFKSTVDDIRSMVVSFNYHSKDIPNQSDEEFSSDGNPIVDDYFASKTKGIMGHDLDSDLSIGDLHSSSFKKGFKLVHGRKYCKYFSSRLH